MVDTDPPPPAATAPPPKQPAATEARPGGVDAPVLGQSAVQEVEAVDEQAKADMQPSSTPSQTSAAQGDVNKKPQQVMVFVMFDTCVN